MNILETRLGEKVAVKLADLDWVEKFNRPNEATIAITIGSCRYEVERDFEEFCNLLKYEKIETCEAKAGDIDHCIIKANVTHIIETSKGTSVLYFRSGNTLRIPVEFPPGDFTDD